MSTQRLDSLRFLDYVITNLVVVKILIDFQLGASSDYPLPSQSWTEDDDDNCADAKSVDWFPIVNNL